MNAGGPHGASKARADIDGGKMDGFVAVQEHAKNTCLDRFNPACASVSVLHDAMGYHDGREIPSYWAYASNFASVHGVGLVGLVPGSVRSDVVPQRPAHA
jgi:phospholipase C